MVGEIKTLTPALLARLVLRGTVYHTTDVARRPIRLSCRAHWLLLLYLAIPLAVQAALFASYRYWFRDIEVRQVAR